MMNMMFVAGTDHVKFTEDVTMLGCKHAIGDHTDCNFHVKLLCTCGTCKSKCNILCNVNLT